VQKKPQREEESTPDLAERNSESTTRKSGGIQDRRFLKNLKGENSAEKKGGGESGYVFLGGDRT